MVQVLIGWPKAALIVGTLAPWALAVISGTGIAPAVSIMEFFVPVTASMKLDPVRLGTVAALGAHFGRTMSPAAAVVIMSARLAGVPASGRRVTIPLLIGGLVLIAAAMAWSY
jgi:DcuC family C4-dicarboxylate transporter